MFRPLCATWNQHSAGSADVSLMLYSPTMQVREKIAALQAALEQSKLDAYVIPSSDPHISEYPPAHWAARAWVSGFDGSAGTVVVTRDRAGLWTDSRYFIAAEQALAGTPFELFREGMPGVPSFSAWLAGELDDGASVGFDASVVSLATLRALEQEFGQKVDVVPGEDLLDAVWSDRPALPSEPLFPHDLRFAGSSRGEKLGLLRKRIERLGATDHVIATLDDIAWLLNLRGSDVPYNPVFVAYLLVSTEEATLFVDDGKVDPELRHVLEADGVAIAPYSRVWDEIGSLPAGRRILISPEQINVRLYQDIPAHCERVEALNPTSWMKARKNASELDSLSDVMTRDGAAMVEFLSWLTGAVASGEQVDELRAEQELRAFRARDEQFVSESFRTISAYRGHGAIVHYSASEASSAVLEQAGVYLLDSGGQYRDGTTDITRTIALGTPSDEQKHEFTLVLKAHISLATARFPVGTTGVALDAIARDRLWREGFNYGHGTGHGVGFFLNVHEGPQRVATRRSDVPLEAGMLVSNEPGLYRADQYGIRIENLISVEEDVKNDFGSFLCFRTLTLCPIDRTLISTKLLTAQEIDWLNRYHREVRERLRGRLSETAAHWLDEACSVIEA